MVTIRMSATATLIFLLLFLFVVGFVFDLLPSKEDLERYYATVVSFEWLQSTAYVEGQYEGVLGTASGWVAEGRDRFTALLNSEYGEYVRRFLMCYAVFAIAIPLFPGYPKTLNKLFGRFDKEDVVVFLLCGVFGGLLFSAWLGYLHVADDTRNWPFEHSRVANSLVGLLLFLPGLAELVVAIAFVASGIIWVPVGLFFLPGFVCALVFAIGKVLFLFVSSPVKLLFITWHYLHYLFVPHPAETAYKTGMTRRVPLPELAATVANAMYQYDLKDFDRLPKAWKSKNWEKRIDTFRERLEAEDKFMDELIKNLRLKAQFRGYG